MIDRPDEVAEADVEVETEGNPETETADEGAQDKLRMHLVPGHPPDPHLPEECPRCSSGQVCWDREYTWGDHVPSRKRRTQASRN